MATPLAALRGSNCSVDHRHRHRCRRRRRRRRRRRHRHHHHRRHRRRHRRRISVMGNGSKTGMSDNFKLKFGSQDTREAL